MPTEKAHVLEKVAPASARAEKSPVVKRSINPARKPDPAFVIPHTLICLITGLNLSGTGVFRPINEFVPIAAKFDWLIKINEAFCFRLLNL